MSVRGVNDRIYVKPDEVIALVGIIHSPNVEHTNIFMRSGVMFTVDVPVATVEKRLFFVDPEITGSDGPYLSKKRSHYE